MIALLFLLIVFHGSVTWGQEFACGFHLTQESEDGAVGASGHAVGASGHNEADYRDGTIRPVVLFGKFNGAGNEDLTELWDREGVANQNADALLDDDHLGSLAHFFSEMSDGNLTLAPPPGGINTTWFESVDDSIDDYVGATCGGPSVTTWHAGVRRFVGEVIADAEASIDFSDSAYDRPDDTDTLVDLVIVVVPGIFGRRCGPNGTVLYQSHLPGLTADGVGIEAIITTDFRPSMPWIAGILVHEYGHVMGLPELFDRTHVLNPSSRPETHGAGIGRWGAMAWGFGWPHIPDRDSGPNPLSVWSRTQVGWITPEPVTADRLNVQIHDINSSNGRAYRLPVSSSEYFLVVNRQNGYPTEGRGSYYDALAPASGLAIYHVDESVVPGSNDANNNELHKRVDLECADGLFSDRGYPGTMPDAVDGGDNLDYWADDSAYRTRNNGSNDRGDTTDLWNGPIGDLTTDRAFTPYSNPSTAGYNGNSQNVRSGIAVRDIQALPGGIVQADFHLNYWSGSITANTTWNGTVTVGGDVTVASGVTLTLDEDTQVRFLADTDDTDGGDDTARSELIVEGTLTATENGITFGSFNTTDPSNDDWYGIRVENRGTATLTGVTVRDAVHCAKAETGGTLTSTGITLSNCGTPPTVTGSASVSFAENRNRTDAVATYSATDAENDAVTWSLVDENGDDAFSIDSGGGVLSFQESPNYEEPTAAGHASDADLATRNVYRVTVLAEDGQAASTEYEVTVTVIDVDEPGTVSLSTRTPPYNSLLSATLEDPDVPLTEQVWQWQRRDPGSDWVPIPGLPPILSRSKAYYRVAAQDYERELRATVSYRDAYSRSGAPKSGYIRVFQREFIACTERDIEGFILYESGLGSAQGYRGLRRTGKSGLQRHPEF